MRLECFTNKIAKLDLTKSPKLQYLYAAVNKLTSLDVSKNTKMVEMQVCEQSGKGIDAVDVSRMKDLVFLDVSMNHRISKINVKNCAKLVHLDVTDNNLTALDVSRNTRLQKLWLEGNRISKLNVSKLPELTHLWCGTNQLKTVDVSKNAKLTSFRCHDNPIKTYDIAKLPASLKALALNDDIREIDTDADMIRWFVSDDEHLTFPSQTRLVNGEEVVYEPEED